MEPAVLTAAPAAKQRFKCEFCAKDYGTKSAKNHHMREKHKQELQKKLEAEAVTVIDEDTPVTDRGRKRAAEEHEQQTPTKKQKEEEVSKTKE